MGKFAGLIPNLDEMVADAEKRLAELISTDPASYEASTLVLRPTYSVQVGELSWPLADMIGKGVMLSVAAGFTCQACGAERGEPYPSGYCYTCFTTLARADLCFVSPNRCHFHEGTCREPEFGETVCMASHSVYLAVSSGPKVGITRTGREHRRWLDQGASRGIVIASAPTRRAAGFVEHHLAQFVNDRTNWKGLIQGQVKDYDLQALARQLREKLPSFEGLADNAALSVEEAAQIRWVTLSETRFVTIDYPKIAPSPAVKLLRENLSLRDNLHGIVGQYLLFSQGVVHTRDLIGREIELEVFDRIEEPSGIAQQDGSNQTNQMNLF